jgi:hypothetical protein
MDPFSSGGLAIVALLLTSLLGSAARMGVRRSRAIATAP